MSERLTVVVAKDGAIHCDLNGFSGDACVQAENRLRQAMAAFGLVVKDQAPPQRKDGGAQCAIPDSVVKLR